MKLVHPGAAVTASDDPLRGRTLCLEMHRPPKADVVLVDFPGSTDAEHNARLHLEHFSQLATAFVVMLAAQHIGDPEKVLIQKLRERVGLEAVLRIYINHTNRLTAEKISTYAKDAAQILGVEPSQVRMVDLYNRRDDDHHDAEWAERMLHEHNVLGPREILEDMWSVSEYIPRITREQRAKLEPLLHKRDDIQETLLLLEGYLPPKEKKAAPAK